MKNNLHLHKMCIFRSYLLYEIINIKEVFESIKYPKESWKKTFGENAFVNEEKTNKTNNDIEKDEDYAKIENMFLKHSYRDIAFNFFKSANENLKQGKLEQFFYDSANLCKFYTESKKELDEADLNFLKGLQSDLSKFEKEKITSDVHLAWACTILLYEIFRLGKYLEKINNKEHLDAVYEIFNESLEKYGEKEVLDAIEKVAASHKNPPKA